MADLNALIAQGGQFKAPPDPFAQYAQMQQLTQGQQANELHRMQMQEYARGASEQNQLRQLDPSAPDYLSQVTRINPKMGFEFGKLQQDALTAQTTRRTAQLEQQKKIRDFENQALRDLSLNPSPENIKAFGQDAVLLGLMTPEQADAKVRQYLSLPPEQLRSMLAGAGATAGELKPSTHVVDQSGIKSLVQFPAFGGVPSTLAQYRDVPLPADVQAQKLATARAGASRVAVTNVGETEYAKKVGGGAGEEDVTTYRNMQQLPADMAKVREILNILKKSDINTGIGAELFTVLDKARAQVLADKKAGNRATGTEYLDSLLGSAVFPQIQALGIGARGMDTPAEREFLRKVMTGTISLNKDTLIKLTELRAKGLEELGSRFNRRVASGEMDNFFKASGRRPSTINLGEPVIAPSAESQIPTAAPKAPPIFAVNPTTKQRIMSTDGGSTWTQAR